MCPSSNIATRAVATLAEHPIVAFRDAGVVVTVNSDDPPMFGTVAQRGVRDRGRPARLDRVGVAGLATAAIDASFAPDDVRARVRGEIADYLATAG